MSNLQTQAVNFIRFHGLTLLVVEHEGVEYVPLKPLSDLAGIDWRNTKRAAFEPDNVTLLGVRSLNPPVFAAPGGDITPTPEAIYIRLDRARMYLARINTARMRAHGKEEAAELLLQLQVEWAEALHAYESHGIAVKKGKRDARAELVALIKARGTTPTQPERVALSNLIAEALAELGQELPADPQITLPGV
jgi:hypothetical protein